MKGHSKCHDSCRDKCNNRCDDPCKDKFDDRDRRDCIDDEPEETDYLVVGAGAAGSIVAGLLAKAGRRVVVIEQGKNHTQDPLVNGGFATLFNLGLTPNPAAGSDLTASSKYAISKLVPDQVNTDFLGQSFLYETFTVGTGSGGGTAHNYLLHYWGPGDEYNTWAAVSGNPAWTAAALLKYRKGIETFTGTSQLPAERGTKGAIFSTQSGPPPTGVVATTTAAVTGSPILEDYNVSNGDLSVVNSQLFVTPNFANFPFGLTRSYPYPSYLGPTIVDYYGFGVDGHKIRVLFGRTGIRILFKKEKNGDIRGHSFEYLDRNKRTRVIRVRNEIILCAGATADSAILERSGVGDETVLTQQGIKPVIINPNVGTQLQFHYAGSYSFKDPVGGGAGNGFFANVSGQPYLTQFNPAQRNLEIQLSEEGGLSPEVQNILIPPGTGSFIGGFIWNLRPASLGTAHIISQDPAVLPDIRYNLFSDPTGKDLQAALGGYKLMRDVSAALSAATGQDYGMLFPPASHFTTGNDDLLTIDAIAGLFSNAGALSNHYIGTCKMGASAATAVVDGQLRLFGAKGVRVASSSIAPVIAGGNTEGMCLLIGTLCAVFLGVPAPFEL